MEQIFIKAYHHKDDKFSIDLETYIIVNIYKLSDNFKVQLNVELLENKPEPHLEIDFSKILFNTSPKIPSFAHNCVWPIIVDHNNYIIAGLCSVSRQIIKTSGDKMGLLGFRKACLMTCSESSIWTRFCEVDMLNTVKKILQKSLDYLVDEDLHIPQDLQRFEHHMEQPLRMHNIYKFARETKNDKGISSKVPVNELDLHHTFSEGPFMTLADVILFFYFEIFYSCFSINLLENNLPLTSTWFKLMQKQIKLIPPLNLQNKLFSKVITPLVVKQSLYTADPNRYRPEKRIFTKQNDIVNSLKIIENSNLKILNNITPYGDDVHFNWVKIPHELNPTGGALPQKRAQRKCEQLQNLTKSVMKLVGDERKKIVDFCSGSGHLGLLLAYLLPNCEIVLIENKEQSLIRAKNRVKSQNLKNVIMLQSNLDYFVGRFDIGVALHACGVATDLVIQNCIQNSACFVCCPCCYGATRDCHHIKFPRSEQFRNCMNVKDYLILAHSADQTHDSDNDKTSQGYFCMDIVDTDRKLFAESYGYEVYLGKLTPVSCTNKNNLLVGIYKNV